jgi:hypothetical protein
MITQSAKFRRLAFINRPDPAARVPRGNKFQCTQFVATSRRTQPM